jgi:two-component system, chemotaxis family, protein-glutamate methylesterase/glutaminase
MKDVKERSPSKNLVVIVCSTGGPKALGKVITKFPEKIDCSILIVQHMPQGFTLSLAKRLDDLSHIKVKEGENDEVLMNDMVYIAKGGYQMQLKKIDKENHKIILTDEVGKNGLKPCADNLFESLKHTSFQKIICTVLTGMGSDGTQGIKNLKEKKDIYVIVQDEDTSTVFGMPKAIIDAGLTNEIVSIDNIADAILRNLGV